MNWFLNMLVMILERGVTFRSAGRDYGISLTPVTAPPAPAPRKAKRTRKSKKAKKAKKAMSITPRSPAAEDFKKFRAALGISQARFAHRLGVSGPHVSNVENGKCAPSAALIAKAREVVKLNGGNTRTSTN